MPRAREGGMRAATVIGLVILAGCAWGAAFGEEVSGGARQANGRYALGPGAVAEALTGGGLVVRAEQVQLPGSLSATVPAPMLRVAGAEARGEGRLVVRLRCGVASECLPFFAEVRMGDAAEAEAAVGRLRASATTPAVAGVRVPAAGGAGEMAEASPVPRGVAVGARVWLELADAQMRIALPGIAVDTGAPGSEVRVTSLDRRHTYRGVVVDAGTVKGGVE